MKNLFIFLAFLYITKSYSQDPELLDKEWFLHYGILNGENFYPLQNFSVQVFFQLAWMSVYHNDCSDGIDSEIEYQSNNGFALIDPPTNIIGVCHEPDLIEFMAKHYSVYHIIGQDIAKNPFTYTIETDGDNYMLTIENGEGDIAVYGSVLLSQPEFLQLQVAFYPNPVKDILHVNSTEIINKVSVFDISGKVVKEIHVNSQNIEIGVSHLPVGVYFVKAEAQGGEFILRKLVKR